MSMEVKFWNSTEVRMFSKLGYGHGEGHGNMDEDMET
jgi:hypothetical protein